MNNLEIISEVLREVGRRDAAELRERAPQMTETAIIDEEQKIPDFVQGKDYTGWERNTPVADEGQVWLLLQPYNTAAHPGHPSELRMLWGLAHTKNPEKAKEFVAPYGTSGLYMTDECVIEDGTVYRCKRDNVDHRPSELPEAWEAVNQ